jgi:glycerol-3-phosphate dehydrogenase (NAD(P)+)
MKHIAVLAEGAWGTAVATLLAHNGYHVRLWCYHRELVDIINKTHRNDRFLPGITLDTKIKAVATIDQAVCDAQWVFEAIPVKFLRASLQKAVACMRSDQIWVVLSKGIEQDTLLFPSQIIDDVFNRSVTTAIFAGPSFAMDVAQKKITAITIAATDCTIGIDLQKLVTNDYFRPYITTDVMGVQAGAALKNVITLGIGMLDGAGYTDNTKAFLLTRGLHEMVQLAQAVGGKQETVYGLSGVGDLVLTSMGSLSKNLMVGKQLGKGKTLDIIAQETGSIPEGINTVQSVYQFMNKQQLALPICKGIYDIIFNKKSVQDFLTALMNEPLSWECEEKKGRLK